MYRVACQVREHDHMYTSHAPLLIVLIKLLSLLTHRHGESNPTYHLRTSSGQEYVLRKRPPGKLLPGAHRVSQLCI